MGTPAQPNRRFLAPGDKLGKHEVIRQLAVGGMAELYLTRTVGIEGFEKLVCVKRILPQHVNDPSFVAMFLNEARLAATLRHPNIAQVYEIDQEAGEYFFSMEYVHGEDLGRLVASGRENGVQISLDCALTIGAGLCAGLHHAHDKTGADGQPLGIVHRDVSPANVLVSYDGAVKLVDFGLARAGNGPSTSHNGLKGKIAYMSPEQCRGRVALDRRSDVFAIGTILYELTTGQVPFLDETEYGVLHQIVNRDADPPSTLVPSYPPALAAIVMRALARDPDQRYATALELQRALEDFAHDNRLRVSPLVLARLMSTVFPARLEEWDHARAQGAFFVEQHVVRTLVESGKTADKAPRYTPPELAVEPLADLATAPTDPDPTVRTTGLAAQAAQALPAAVAQALPGLPPVTQPLPPPVTQPLVPPAPSPAAPGRSARVAPIPNMPGAVPILRVMPAPPVPSGGTLVSSATQAGTPPPMVLPLKPPMFTPAGSGDFEPYSVASVTGSYPGLSDPGVFPSGLAYQTAADGLTGRRAPAALPRFDDAGGDDFGRETSHHTVADLTERVRAATARKTEEMRSESPSSRPVIAIVAVGVIAAALGVGFAVRTAPAAETSHRAPTNARTGTVASKPVASAPLDPGPSTTAAAPPGATVAAPPGATAAATATPAIATTASAPPGATASDDPAAPAAVPRVVPSSAAVVPRAQAAAQDPPADPIKKKPSRMASQESRPKAVKSSRGRAVPKPGGRASKAGAKEEAWDDDSPFLPEPTVKR